MPYLPLSELEKQKLQQEGQQQNVSGPSGVITSGVAGQPSAGGAKGPSKSGSFTNLNAYLDANKDQGEILAGRVAGKVASQGDEAKSAVNQLSDSFKSKVDASSVRPNEQLINEAASDTQNFIKDSGKVEQFQKMKDGRFSGPTNLVDEDGYGNTVQKISDVKSKLKATESESGRMAMVQDQFNKPTYSKGQQRLDQLLLQNAPGARQTFENVRSQFSDLDSVLESANQSSNQYALQAKQDTENARQLVENRFLGTQGVVPQFKSDLDSRTAKVQSEASVRAQMAENILRGQADGVSAMNLGDENESASVYQKALSDLGVNQDQVNTLLSKQKELEFNYGVKFDPMEFLQRVSSPESITRDAVASADEYARYQALRQLLGLEDQYFTDSSRLGTANPDTVDYRYDDALNAVTSRIAQAEAEKRATQEQRNREATPSSGDIWDNVEHIGETITGGIADTTNMITQPIARTGNWLKKRFSDKRLKTDVKKSDFSDIEKYLKGKC